MIWPSPPAARRPSLSGFSAIAYERLLDQDLSGANFTTNGQILSSVLKKEREGGYLGRDVQVIPHVTGEIKLKLRELAAKSNADVVFVEVGGTVGDYENAYRAAIDGAA